MTKRMIDIATADGPCRAGLFIPDGGAKAAVILFMDIFGPRPALDAMAERLVAAGYAVLVPDLFHRFGDRPVFEPKTAFSDEATKERLFGMLRATTQALTIADTGAFLDALSAEGFSGPVGVTGYCMGGARALNVAAAWPDRIAAAASFHGGNLAADAEDSPHRHAAKMKARIYVGAAGVDGSFPPEQAGKLAEALRTAEVDHVIENYAGTKHGWCVPDHSVFDAAGAERHWKRLVTLFSETLAA
ncbi:dienelactone hydrolase family protein [Aquibium sp. ELW1220]|uniref:dienelactone hydrolase family protein n=1 Tax=Aquibium sp. ELW1220 TaxID=2976766 RepID=UPI0025B21CE6|nr:dienelactone hydrolase family protein [Aquibium sp. ELW1220]MDN2580372.1 dienelactone hydrolase family protein [Aquibium sp. ELW1220]